MRRKERLPHESQPNEWVLSQLVQAWASFSANRMHEEQRLSQNCSYLATGQNPRSKTKAHGQRQCPHSQRPATWWLSSGQAERGNKREEPGGGNRAEKAHGTNQQEGGKVERIKDKRKQKSHKTIERDRERDKEGLQREAQASQK